MPPGPALQRIDSHLLPLTHIKGNKKAPRVSALYSIPSPGKVYRNIPIKLGSLKVLKGWDLGTQTIVTGRNLRKKFDHESTDQ